MKPLITCIEAKNAIEKYNTLFIDCSYSLSDENFGIRSYVDSHIPGALYADLKADLSSEVIIGKTGRHPLPEKQKLVDFFSKLGIKANTYVIAYDLTFGYMAASRLWWLLKWAGHEKVSVLFGGKNAWKDAGYELTKKNEEPKHSQFVASFNDEFIIKSDKILESINGNSNDFTIIDSRAEERYLGKNETIDPIAGHIPTAISIPFEKGIPLFQSENIDELRSNFSQIKRDPVFYCGSGVTATYNILLYVAAGYSMPKLYPGSWSEWITDSKNPLE